MGTHVGRFGLFSHGEADRVQAAINIGMHGLPLCHRPITQCDTQKKTSKGIYLSIKFARALQRWVTSRAFPGRLLRQGSKEGGNHILWARASRRITLWWRSGGVKHPHDTPPYHFIPSPTFRFRIILRHARKQKSRQVARGN